MLRKCRKSLSSAFKAKSITVFLRFCWSESSCTRLYINFHFDLSGSLDTEQDHQSLKHVGYATVGFMWLVHILDLDKTVRERIVLLNRIFFNELFEPDHNVAREKIWNNIELTRWVGVYLLFLEIIHNSLHISNLLWAEKP